MSDTDYKYGYPVGPYYRKFMVGDIWCEVNCDHESGLWLHSGNSFEGHPGTESKPIYFSSEEQFMEFCTKLIGIDRQPAAQGGGTTNPVSSLSLLEKKSLVFKLLEELYQDDQIFIDDLNNIVKMITGISLSELMREKP